MITKILIADDHFVVRAGTGMTIEKSIENVSVDYAENYSQVLEKLSLLDFDIIFLDINMPGSKNELMIKEILKVHNKIKIIVFSAHEENVAVKYLNEGAHGYLNKLSPREKIIEAIQSISNDGYYYSPKIMHEMFLINQKIKKMNPFEDLSEREKEVALLLMEGNGNLEISNILNIKMSTISTFKKRIFNKLNVKNIIELSDLYKENNG